MNTILMYVVNSEAEIPSQPPINSAYYILGKEVRIVDNGGSSMTFSLVRPTNENDKIEERLSTCEKQVAKIIKHLTSFTEEV